MRLHSQSSRKWPLSNHRSTASRPDQRQADRSSSMHGRVRPVDVLVSERQVGERSMRRREERLSGKDEDTRRTSMPGILVLNQGFPILLPVLKPRLSVLLLVRRFWRRPRDCCATHAARLSGLTYSTLYLAYEGATAFPARRMAAYETRAARRRTLLPALLPLLLLLYQVDPGVSALEGEIVLIVA